MISKKELQKDIKDLSYTVEYAIKNGGNNYKLVDERIKAIEGRVVKIENSILFLKNENKYNIKDFACIRSDIRGILGYLKIRKTQKIISHNTPFEKIPAKRRKSGK